MTTGLVVTYQLGTRLPQVVPPPTPLLPPEPIGPPGTLNMFVHVRADDQVVLTIAEVEMGQGITTALAQVLADELRARWDQVQVVPAPLNPEAYGEITTDRSSSMRDGYGPLRRMGALARQMLVQAAALTWGVPQPQCEASDGQVHHPATKRSLTYGQLAEVASRQRPPAEPFLLPTDQQTLVGRSLRPRGRDPALRGETKYGLDVRIPSMQVVQVAHPPLVGATVERFDDTAARSVPGVARVVQISSGVAVVAENTWAAEQGRRALDIDWSKPSGRRLDARRLEARLKAASRSGDVVFERGDVGSLAASTRKVSATFQLPFLAHGMLEPLSCTAHVQPETCEVWVGTQSPSRVRAAAAAATGLKEEQVTVHATAMGGAFGRRLLTDFVEEAIEVSKKTGRPAQVVWSRADDVRGGRYRPAAFHRLTGYLDGAGDLVGWSHAIGSASGANVNHADPVGLAMVYGVPNYRLTYGGADLPLSAGPWRSGEHSHVAVAVECFMDEMARAAGRDPLEFRKKVLADQPRYLRVLDAVAEAAEYATRPPGGRARGLAVYGAYGSVVAQIAEVSLRDRRVQVHKVWCAVDCGRAVNPDGVRAQMEGSIAFGLSAALYGRLSLKDGQVQESNFHDYRILRLREMPEVDVRLVPSGGGLGGVGEPGVPPVAPAVANAVAQLRRRPIRRLPLT